MKPEAETPRTDALASHHLSHVHPWNRTEARLNRMTDLARQLERALSQSQEALAEARRSKAHMLVDAEQRIQQAEQLLNKALPSIQFHSEEVSAQNEVEGDIIWATYSRIDAFLKSRAALSDIGAKP